MPPPLESFARYADSRSSTPAASRLAEATARNYRNLRARGRTVRKTIDFLIATFCLEHSHALLHCNRDFDPFEDVLGLQVVHPGGSE
ncbi:MAG: hypothetical protein AB7N65_20800 [Vicinamibacterales bacterium]